MLGAEADISILIFSCKQKAVDRFGNMHRPIFGISQSMDPAVNTESICPGFLKINIPVFDDIQSYFFYQAA